MSRLALRTVSTLAVLGASIGLASGEDPQQVDYDALVEQLASSNTPPEVFPRGRLTSFPKNYDWAAQKRIARARAALYEGGEAALPALVKAIGDDRYSATIGYDEEKYRNLKVGAICISAIADLVEVYRVPQQEELMSQKIHGEFARTPAGVKMWWEANRGKRLADIQSASLEGAIDMMAEGSKNFPENKNQYDRLIKRLSALQRRLADEGKPIIAKPAYSIVIEPPIR